MTVGSRETQTFTVTFYPNKGVGDFKSIMLASPELSREELEVADDGDEFAKKGSLGIISLNLSAAAIQPILSIDKKHKMDGDTHLTYKFWSVGTNVDPDAPSNTKKIIYTNDTKADLTFNLNVSEGFEIVKTKSNTGAKHPLSTQTPPTKRKYPLPQI